MVGGLPEIKVSGKTPLLCSLFKILLAYGWLTMLCYSEDCKVTHLYIHKKMDTRMPETALNLKLTHHCKSRRLQYNFLKPRQRIKSRDITWPTNVHVIKAMVFPVVTYECESWTIKKAF